MQTRYRLLLTLSLVACLSGFCMMASTPAMALVYPPDVNGDGSVDVLDLVAISTVIGTMVSPGAPEDTNEDGTVNLFDLVTVATHFGTEASVVSSAGAPVVKIAPWCSQFDAPGNDDYNLNEEYVCFEHAGGDPVDMTGWHVEDEQGKVYTFPSFTLSVGAHVRLRTGSGTDTSTDLYWGEGRSVWGNLWHGRDTVFLYDDQWVPKDWYSYSP
jgi:competence protein ComEC